MTIPGWMSELRTGVLAMFQTWDAGAHGAEYKEIAAAATPEQLNAALKRAIEYAHGQAARSGYEAYRDDCRASAHAAALARDWIAGARKGPALAPDRARAFRDECLLDAYRRARR